MAKGVFGIRELARRAKISKSAAQRIVATIYAQWKAETKDFAARALTRQLVSFQQRRIELHAAWKQSKKDAETITTRTTAKGTETTRTVAGRAGDVGFQRELGRIDEQEAKLLGLLKETSSNCEPDGPDLAHLTTDQLLAIAAEIQEAIAQRQANNEPGGSTP